MAGEQSAVIDEGMAFDVVRMASSVGQFSIPMLGTFNVQNALRRASWLRRNSGSTNVAIQQGFHTFKSVKRRLELRGEVDGVRVYDDFAHHPTAVAGDACGGSPTVSLAIASGRYSSHDRKPADGACLNRRSSNRSILPTS